MGQTYRIVDAGKDRQAWLEARKNSLGASEAAAVMGISRFSSPMKVYADKVIGAEPFDSDVMRFGRIYEAQIAKDYSASTGRRVKLDGRLIIRATRSWQSCTLDAIQYDEEKGRGLAEFKTSLFGWDADGIPEDYYCQIQHQFAVTGLPWGSAVMFNRTSCEMVYQDVEPDLAYIRRLIDEEEGFWFGNVLGGQPPGPDAHKATRDALRRLYPTSEAGVVIPFEVALLEKRDRRAFLVARLKGDGEEKEGIDNAFKCALKDAERGEFPDGSGFSWKADKRGRRSFRAKEG